MSAKEDRKGRGSQTTWSQLSAILEWLEISSNFKLITGGASQNHVVAGSKLKKTDAYRDLANFINAKLGYTRPCELWDAKKAKSRYEAQLKKYKDVKREFGNPSGPKFCLTEAEMASGMTIDSKRDKACPQFQRWDNLFGSRQNISPYSTMEPGDEELESTTNPSFSPIHSRESDEEMVVLGGDLELNESDTTAHKSFEDSGVSSEDNLPPLPPVPPPLTQGALSLFDENNPLKLELPTNQIVAPAASKSTKKPTSKLEN